MSSMSYSCASCGYSAAQWFGRCPSCAAWSSLERPCEPCDVEVVGLGLDSPGFARERLSSAMPEVDRVLGGGLVPGSVLLLSGEPGIGKSTFVLQLMDGLASAGRSCLLVTGEESVGQVAMRARRLGFDHETQRVRACAASSLQEVLAAWTKERPDAIVVDSIQTLSDASSPGSAGSVAQVRACAAALVRHAKASGTSALLVGHVTKDGSVAGPKTLEHVVDVVLSLEGERSGGLRLLRATKNRYGSCEESAVFVMTGRGLEVVDDPSALLLADRRPAVPGSIVFPALQGSRPLLVEIQALVSSTKLAQPRRVAIGLEARRLALLLGVLCERVSLPVAAHDVFVAAAGGLVVSEPAADLALCLALFSAARACPIDERTVAIGEVGLAGEVRRARGCERRLAEAARLGFRTALVPPALAGAARGVELVAVSELSEAFAIVSRRRAAPSRAA